MTPTTLSKVVRQEPSSCQHFWEEEREEETPLPSAIEVAGEKPLENAQHEAFAQARAAGKNLVEAYRSAGYCSNGAGAYSSASRLIRNDKVRARVEYLQQQVALVAGVNQASLLCGLMENVRLARENRNFASANRSLEVAGRLLGMFRG